MTISDYISKTKIHTKKIIYAKNERQVISNLPRKFLGAQNAPFYAYFIFSSLRIFYMKIATFQKWEGVCISLVVTGDLLSCIIYLGN